MSIQVYWDRVKCYLGGIDGKRNKDGTKILGHSISCPEKDNLSVPSWKRANQTRLSHHPISSMNHIVVFIR